jgi:kynureninase
MLCEFEWSSIEAAVEKSQKDSLNMRDAFFIPKYGADLSKDQIYMCGNSLGLQPKVVPELMEQALNTWKNHGVRGHFDDFHKEFGDSTLPRWDSLDDICAKPMADIVGARTHEVVLMNTLTINLNIMLHQFYKPTESRFKILIEEQPFVSDLDAMQALVQSRGYTSCEALVSIPFKSILENNLTTTYSQLNDLVKNAIDTILRDDPAIIGIVIGGVHHATGYVWPMEEITKLAHKYGCWIGLDLAHSVGNVPLQLHDWNVDWAIWCTYKYLNAGPGAIGGLFIHENITSSEDFVPSIRGWYGRKHDNRFLEPNYGYMGPFYKKEWCDGAAMFRGSNPSIFSLVPVYASLCMVFSNIDLGKLFKRATDLTLYLFEGLTSLFKFIRMMQGNNPAIFSMSILTPMLVDANMNIKSFGCQISVSCRHKYKEKWHLELERNLRTEYGIIVDARDPDIIRIAPTPLYNTFEDVYFFIQCFARLLYSNI